MPVGRNVIVIGGGLVGIELAEFLAERKRSVTVLESGEKFGIEMAHPRRARALHEARSHGVTLVASAELVAIRKGEVDYQVGDEILTAMADTVVIASGVLPDESLAERFRTAGLDVRVVGDAASVGYIEGAVRSGYVTARAL
jgi:NADPH-dependent 2,4-dienoyl-CoA reductase/sulfur reductase-like enzyme